MGLDLPEDKHHTLLSEEDKEGLLIPTITTREELDEFEQQNIQNAFEYYLVKKNFTTQGILTEKFIKAIHQRMLGDVWSWAGDFRQKETNLGINWHQIPLRIHQAIENCKFWIANKTFNDDETAVRFKHDVVSIHPFPNGNGRHSRLLADIVAKHIFKRSTFSWGHADLVRKGVVRDIYIDALQKADQGDFTELIAFSRK